MKKILMLFSIIGMLMIAPMMLVDAGKAPTIVPSQEVAIPSPSSEPISFGEPDPGSGGGGSGGSSGGGIEILECKGDLNHDSKMDALDLEPFIDFLITHNPEEFWFADMNGDGFVDYRDVSVFIDVLFGNEKLTCR